MSFSKELYRYAEQGFGTRKHLLGGRRTAVEALLSQCVGEEKILLQYLYATLPLSDLGDYGPELFFGFVRHALAVRGEFAWCAGLPEHQFVRNVLYPRINTEELADCRVLFHDALADRVKALTLSDAILEVNRWCAEEATYRSTDERTASPLAVYRCGYGRCGEESTFAVTALRSVGIAARQVYAPWWSHCDDNHAWVEAFDGENWRFLGACEPEPVLDRGWFTGAASRAILVHARSFVQGTREETAFLFPDTEPVDLDLREDVAYETVTARYALTKRVAVTVLNRDGSPAQGERVRFSVLNMAQFSEIASRMTGKDGRVEIRLGLGCTWVSVFTEQGFGEAMLNVSEKQVLTLVLSETAPNSGWEAFDFFAPLDAPRYPSLLTSKQKQERRDCLDRTSALRERKMAEIKASGTADFTGLREELWKVLTEKDRAGGVPEEIFVDVEQAGRLEPSLPGEIFTEYLLNPRVYRENLTPWRDFILNHFSLEQQIDFQQEPEKVWAWISETIVDSGSYSALCGTPVGILSLKAGNEAGKKLLFCAVCRSLGVPARLSGEELRPEFYRDGAFHEVRESEPLFLLSLKAPAAQEGLFRQNFTLSRKKLSGYETVRTEDIATGESQNLLLFPGCYRLLTVSRMPNGNQFAQKLDFTLASPSMELSLSFREGKISDMLERCELPSFSLRGGEPRGTAEKEIESSIVLGRSNSLLLWLEVSREPTEHILNELREAAEAFRQVDCAIHFVLEGAGDLHDPTLSRTLAELPAAQIWVGDFADTAPLLARRMYVDPERLPLILLADRNGNGVYGCSGYNVGTAELLLRMLAEL